MNSTLEITTENKNSFSKLFILFLFLFNYLITKPKEEHKPNFV